MTCAFDAIPNANSLTVPVLFFVLLADSFVVIVLQMGHVEKGDHDLKG